jgi:replicative DNA helicase
MTMTDKNAHYEQEAALIGAVMVDQKQYDKVKDYVYPKTFDWIPYRHAWESIESLIDKGMGVDVITVGDELDGMGKLDSFQTHHTKIRGRMGLDILRSESTPQNAMTYAGKVVNYAAKRAYLPALEQAGVRCLNGWDANHVKSELFLDLDAIPTWGGKAVKNTVNLSDALSLAEDRTDRASRGEIVTVPTGFIDFDDLLGGGLEAPDFMIVAGRPGTGKSSMLTTIALNVAKTKRVALFSLEMGAQQIAMRMISQISGITYKDQKSGNLDDRDWPVYIHAQGELQALDLHIIDLAAITMAQTRQALRSLGSVDLILFDYIQLARPDEPQGTREQEVGYVSRALKQIASEFNAPLVAGAQLSRDIEKRSIKRPVLSDLRESGSLEQDSDIVTFLHKPDEESNLYQWIVAKHRNGALAPIKIEFVPSKTMFRNCQTERVSFA